MQTIVGQPFSSVNMRSGDLLTVKVSNLNGDIRQAGRIFVHMVAEQIMELRESGVQILD
jgi:elongation factor P hydroxylase